MKEFFFVSFYFVIFPLCYVGVFCGLCASKPKEDRAVVIKMYPNPRYESVHQRASPMPTNNKLQQHQRLPELPQHNAVCRGQETIRKVRFKDQHAVDGHSARAARVNSAGSVLPRSASTGTKILKQQQKLLLTQDCKRQQVARVNSERIVLPRSASKGILKKHQPKMTEDGKQKKTSRVNSEGSVLPRSASNGTKLKPQLIASQPPSTTYGSKNNEIESMDSQWEKLEVESIQQQGTRTQKNDSKIEDRMMKRKMQEGFRQDMERGLRQNHKHTKEEKQRMMMEEKRKEDEWRNDGVRNDDEERTEGKRKDDEKHKEEALKKAEDRIDANWKLPPEAEKPKNQKFGRVRSNRVKGNNVLPKTTTTTTKENNGNITDIFDAIKPKMAKAQKLDNYQDEIGYLWH